MSFRNIPSNYYTCSLLLTNYNTKQKRKYLVGAMGVMYSNSRIALWGDSSILDDVYDKYHENEFILDEIFSFIQEEYKGTLFIKNQ